MSDVESSNKPCRTCRMTFPRTVLYWHRDAVCADGLKLQCRTCANKEARRRYETRSAQVCERLQERRAERVEYFATQPQWKAA
ncbi:hypothetical protein [Streptomyces niveus]|uniref:Uncharacterized protein n=1 Tax=Streptomyces niveus TaxID=193462 RepID=A0ABZ2AAZ6_STRNV|nr:hypothetical protein [Streptomyces niveus]